MSSKNDFVGGIHEEDLGSLAMEILDYSERITTILDDIDKKFESLHQYYDSESYVKFMESYNEFRLNYGVIKSNVVSYSDDLIRLISKMNEGMDSVIDLFNTFTEERKSKAKEIN